MIKVISQTENISFTFCSPALSPTFSFLVELKGTKSFQLQKLDEKNQITAEKLTFELVNHPFCIICIS